MIAINKVKMTCKIWVESGIIVIKRTFMLKIQRNGRIYPPLAAWRSKKSKFVQNFKGHQREFEGI
jgi:hypothetical protein